MNLAHECPSTNDLLAGLLNTHLAVHLRKERNVSEQGAREGFNKSKGKGERKTVF